MTKWRRFSDDPPEKEGQYLAISNFDPGELKDEKPFGSVFVGQYYPEGYEIPLLGNKRYSYIEDPKERLLKVITDPDTMESEGGFYEMGEDDEPYLLIGITHWAELPDMPEEYAGNQNDYDAED